MLTCIIHKLRRQATLAVRGLRSIFCSWFSVYHAVCQCIIVINISSYLYFPASLRFSRLRSKWLLRRTKDIIADQLPTKGNWAIPMEVKRGESALYVILSSHMEGSHRQGHSQPLTPGWPRLENFFNLSSFSCSFSYFSSNFLHFLPHFGFLGGRFAHPGRPWLHHWS